MERRFLSVDRFKVTLTTRAEGPALIRGHAAVYYDGTSETEFDLWDEMRERIMPGAFDRALKEGDDARALFNHDPSALLGRVSAKTLRLSSDAVGLAYEIDLGDTSVARDVREHIKRGDLQGSSFAFEILDEDIRREDGKFIREVRGVRLFDVGPVTFPAYEATDVSARNAEGLARARASLDAFLERERQARGKSKRARIVELGL